MSNICTYDFNVDTQTLTFSNTFNGSLNQYHHVIKQAKKIVFGSNYNQKIKIPSHITDITFGNNYNQPLGLTSELQSLTLGDTYNKLIYLKPATKLKTLYLGADYNQPLVLTPSITKLKLNIAFDQPLELTHNITHLILLTFNLKHQLILTPNIMFLEIYACRVHTFNKRIVHIWLNFHKGETLPVLNKSLVSFNAIAYKQANINFNKYMRNFETSGNMHNTVTFNIPKTMVRLIISKYVGNATIGKNITHLYLNTNQHINLPKHLKFLTYGFSTSNNSKIHILLPVNLKKIVFHNLMLWFANTQICSFNHNVEYLELYIGHCDRSIIVMDNLSDGIGQLVLKWCNDCELFQNLPALKNISMGYQVNK